MAFESIPARQINKVEEPALDPEDEVEELLESAPDEEAAAKWSKQIEGLPTEQQVARLRELKAGRAEALKRTAHFESRELPKLVEVVHTCPEEVRAMAERIRNSKERIEVGYGQAAHVIASPVQPDVCFKILFDEEELPTGTNDISREADIQHTIARMGERHGVRAPEPYFFVVESGMRAIVMEYLNAASVRRILRGGEPFPQNFDPERFFESLSGYMQDMHEAGYYHRDLHGGNVLVDRETGAPYVIDFGLSTYAPIADQDTYRISKPGQKEEIVLSSDEGNLEAMKKEVLKQVRGK